MKTLITLIFVLFIGMAAQAQDAKMSTIEMGIATEITQVNRVKENSVARLYKFKNSRIKKALSFTTKKNKAKLA